MSAGAKVWGYYPADNKWVPLRVDSDGSFHVVGYIDKLDDIGDVNVPTPGDNSFLYWDDAASKWQSRALLDGDIPAAIARDAEVAAGIATHAALKTGVHGVGARKVAETSVEDLDLAVHAARHQNGGADEISVAGLSGELADDQPPKAHKTDHQNGGADEISVAGLSGELADDQPPKAHSHDEIIDADGDTKIQVEEGADEDKIRMDVKGVEAFHLDDAGILTLAKQSGFHAYQTVAQAIPNATNTVMNCGTESFDIQSEFDLANDKFTAKAAGLYLCSAHIQMADIDDGNYLLVYLFLNGAVYAMAQTFSPAANCSLTCPFVSVVQLIATDYLEFKIRHNNGASVNTFPGKERVWCAVAKIA